MRLRGGHPAGSGLDILVATGDQPYLPALLPRQPYLPIEDYAVIGNQVTAALVSRDGSIDWACFPRIDSPSVFGRLLDAARGGHWQIAPVAPAHASRRYLPDTNVLETTFHTEGGTVTLTDFMPPWDAPGTPTRQSEIIRIVRGLAGTIEMRLEFAPRFDYGRRPGVTSMLAGRGLRAVEGGQALTLHSPIDLTPAHGAGHATFIVGAGETVAFALTHADAADACWQPGLIDEAPLLQVQTEAYWRSWLRRCRYDGPYSDAVRRSALTLQLLSYAPTGATVAAVTTSLPEEPGGERNWDYRFTWLRDTTFTLYALNGLGYPEHGEQFLRWVRDLSGGHPARLRVLYGVGGEVDTTEVHLDHLEGYRGSRPVRVGNAAQQQLQLDVYGEILDAAYALYKHTGHLDRELWPFLRATVDHVCRRWHFPDQGIWEVRSGPRQFVYSKALSLVALERGLKLARATGLPAPFARWQRTRDRIERELYTRGFHPERGAFTQAYGHAELDAALLALPLRKVVPADDPRMRATVDRIASELSLGAGLLRRVSPGFADGVRGDEGAFLLCSFWLADCYTLSGRINEARDLFERLLGYANDVGLFAEEYDPVHGHQLGNFPQAFTHMALINAALNLQAAESAGRTRPDIDHVHAAS
ncbi:MAG: glycoside hydrolase family 15 protein [Dehalococcoidia bacterium]